MPRDLPDQQVGDGPAVLSLRGFDPPVVDRDLAGLVDLVAAAGLEDLDAGDRGVPCSKCVTLIV